MIRIQRYPEGARVTVTPGHFPLDPGLVGQNGTVVSHDRWAPTRYGVRLDGETEVRIFDEAELVADADPRASGA